ncbi:hypothetical protein F4781DRAFT_390141 [Annulohypoxylon bovei var. microspora]|nr:hypothetical protein F4781DRAFT_390141 [Annulohypoxylon bovei var. microspora]
MRSYLIQLISVAYLYFLLFTFYFSILIFFIIPPQLIKPTKAYQVSFLTTSYTYLVNTLRRGRCRLLARKLFLLSLAPFPRMSLYQLTPKTPSRPSRGRTLVTI